MVDQLIKRNCPICKSTEYSIEVFNSNLPNDGIASFQARGAPSGYFFSQNYCKKCQIQYSSTTWSKDTIINLYKNKSSSSNLEFHIMASDTAFNLVEPLIDSNKIKSVLEVGCGPGHFLKNCEDLNLGTQGIDPENIETPQSANILNTTFEEFQSNEKYDLICCFHGLEHIESPSKFIEFCSDYLSPKGHVAFIYHDQNALPHKILRKKSPLLDLQHYQLFTEFSLCKLMHQYEYTHLKTTSVKNEYPLKYWLSLVGITSNSEIKIKIKAGNKISFFQKN
jgi:2-polyprenyl-3-methyl-5-hydroxy-6-metoxy-1,4-benzoquinol methylase